VLLREQEDGHDGKHKYHCSTKNQDSLDGVHLHTVRECYLLASAANQ